VASAPERLRTRTDLHRVAEHVLAAARYAADGRIGLLPADRGLRTPPYGSNGRVLEVDGGDLLVHDGDGTQRHRLTTLRAAGVAAGVQPGAPAAVYTPVTSLDLDASLQLDPESVLGLARWWLLGEAALARFTLAAADDRPGDAQLWPEHLDLALTSAAVNYGVSAGDDLYPEPYLYVGPHTPPAAAGETPDDPFWDAPFGAVRLASAIGSVEEALAFFLTGREAVRSAAARNEKP